MSTKSVFYLIVCVTLLFLFSALKEVAIEFIKSTNEGQRSSMPFFMVPSAEGFQQRLETPRYHSASYELNR